MFYAAYVTVIPDLKIWGGYSYLENFKLHSELILTNTKAALKYPLH